MIDLFGPLTQLKIQPPLQKRLVHLAQGDRVIDLLLHAPINILHRLPCPTASFAKKQIQHQKCKIALPLTIQHHHHPSTKKSPFKIVGTDPLGEDVDLTFFNGQPAIWIKKYPLGSNLIVIGTPDLYLNRLSFSHPEQVVYGKTLEQLDAIEVIYPLTAGITQYPLRSIILTLLARLNAQKYKLNHPTPFSEGPDFYQALWALHHPKTQEDLSPLSVPRQRLAFDELLSQQLAMGFSRRENQQKVGTSHKGDNHLIQNILSQLPFDLTPDQKQVWQEIDQDLASTQRMMRLLLGDVGSGKTIIGLMTILRGIEAGKQGAFLAPTDILARQHFNSLHPFLKDLNLNVALLTGRHTAKQKKEIYEGLLTGHIDVIVGTHALIQESLEFSRLGVVVIDEQHRFGVQQRLNLTRKGPHTDVLLMSATPIPRTLLMAHYGDLDLSQIRHKPPGRQPITTLVKPQKEVSSVYAALQRAIENKDKIYWVCPLIEESDALDYTPVLNRFQDLVQHFGLNKVALIHGRMKGAEKDQAMDRFMNGSVDILVATTVIEVGVNIPQANVMVIEHAEHFGLAQLHQLRGRVGRSDRPSWCVLLYGYKLSAVGKRRLEVMRQTDDGFLIAEEDLKLRGGGEILGTQQSGQIPFRCVDFDYHLNLLNDANRMARHMLTDPQQSQNIETLLHLFNRAEAILYHRTG